jgi:dCMP deaminase
MDVPNWDDVYMTMAYLVASKSKDNNTHIGAVVIGPDNEVRSTGYNGFVRGLDDSVNERQERPEKYYWFEHAERNAIFNATLMGVSLKGCRMYTNGIPCMDCSRGVVQSGINEVIVDYSWDKKNSDKWKEHAERALKMFSEVGVEVRYYEGNFVDVSRFRDGVVSSLF